MISFVEGKLVVDAHLCRGNCFMTYRSNSGTSIRWFSVGLCRGLSVSVESVDMNVCVHGNRAIGGCKY